jgi:hypothetical protein
MRDWDVDLKAMLAVHRPTMFTMHFSAGRSNKQWEQHTVRVTGPDGRVYIGRPVKHTEPERHPVHPRSKTLLVPEGAGAFSDALRRTCPDDFPDYESGDA